MKMLTRSTVRRALSLDGILTIACVLCVSVTLWNVKALWAHSKTRDAKLIADWQKYAASGNRIGPVAAPVQIVTFIDYECPYCKRIDPTLRAVQHKNPGKIAIIYRNFPIATIHHDARIAAIASECAAEQHAFESYSEALYKEAELVARHDWGAIASRAHIAQPDSLRRCVDAGRLASRLSEDSTAARSLGVVATPTLLINGRLIAGTLTSDEIDREVELALGRRPFWTRLFSGL